MKHRATYIFGLLLALCSFAVKAQQIGIFQSYIIISVDGGSNIYRAGGANADNAPAFNGSSYTPNSSIILNGGEIKSFKNNGGNVTAARLYYRVYPVNGTPGNFNLVDLPFNSDLNGNGDQKWTTTNAGINLANGLPSGNYTIEAYWQITGTPSDQFDSNNGANYKATFTVTSGTLPVNLVSFTAKASGLMAGLDWATTGETNNAYFDVERSPDAVAFAKVGQVAGQGTTNTRRQYTFTDEAPASGINYYRLKQVDVNGIFSYSPIRAVAIRTNGEVTILGNPASTDLQVAGVLPGSTAQLLDLNGQLRHQQAAGQDRLQFDVRNLPAGTYFLRIVEATGTLTKRVLVAH